MVVAETVGGMEEFVRNAPDRAVWAIGQDVSIVTELVARGRSGEIRPALVIALPAGFVGAVEAKQAVRELGIPALTNRGERGGAALATAAVNALLYL
jgi:precorrin-8X/cobalt-precorrin-8 methylmutase